MLAFVNLKNGNTLHFYSIISLIRKKIVEIEIIDIWHIHCNDRYTCYSHPTIAQPVLGSSIYLLVLTSLSAIIRGFSFDLI